MIKAEDIKVGDKIKVAYIDDDCLIICQVSHIMPVCRYNEDEVRVHCTVTEVIASPYLNLYPGYYTSVLPSEILEII